jgi:hypothetical protein
MCLNQKKKEKNAYLSHLPKGKTMFLIAIPIPKFIIKKLYEFFFHTNNISNLSKEEEEEKDFKTLFKKLKRKTKLNIKPI